MCDDITVAAAELLAGLCCDVTPLLLLPLELQGGHLLLVDGGLLLVLVHGVRGGAVEHSAGSTA